MLEILLAFFVGAITGAFFTFLKLPLPAPPVLSGVVGIFGIYFGSVIVHFFKYIHKLFDVNLTIDSWY
ncbi:TPA: XapX domain-containing protein [Klebsiella pneumoniae]